MSEDSYPNMCIFNTLDGLRDGLSHFSQPSRVALIYAVRPDDPIRVYDPQNLLHGHEPILKEIYFDSDDWKKAAADLEMVRRFGQIQVEKNLELAGLISCGGRSYSIFYQMWFTEHHPDICSTGPIERWLEHAAWLLSHDFSSENKFCTGSSGHVLREYATHAVRDYIVNDLLCSFADGNFHSTTYLAKMVQMEEALLESRLDSDATHAMFKIVTRIVHKAGKQKYGCTLVIDLNEQPIYISGQHLREPLDLTDEKILCMAKDLAQVDGALHIGADLHLHGFACLLDGRAVAGEDRARGARFNSALRFTSENPNLIVIVVSVDKPVSVIQEGVELNAQCALKPVSWLMTTPPTMKTWLEAAGF